jgi:hypothetical protein
VDAARAGSCGRTYHQVLATDVSQCTLERLDLRVHVEVTVVNHLRSHIQTQHLNQGPQPRTRTGRSLAWVGTAPRVLEWQRCALNTSQSPYAATNSSLVVQFSGRVTCAFLPYLDCTSSATVAEHWRCKTENWQHTRGTVRW